VKRGEPERRPHIYTGRGDRGYTYCTITRSNVAKTHPCVEFMGSLDEAEAATGLARSLLEDSNGPEKLIDELRWVEETLFRVGFTLAGRKCIDSNDTRRVEETIDRYADTIEPVFSLNNGHPAAAATGLARTTVRRAERNYWRCRPHLEGKIPVEDLVEVGRLLNRLSDLLYVIQHAINKWAGASPEHPSCKGSSTRGG